MYLIAVKKNNQGIYHVTNYVEPFNLKKSPSAVMTNTFEGSFLKEVNENITVQ